MNRLESYFKSQYSDSIVGIANPYDDRKSTREAEFPNRIFIPEYYEPRYAYPVVIWLHSQDSSEHEIDVVMPHVSLRNYLAVGLRGVQPGRSDRRFRWSLSNHVIALTERRIEQLTRSLDESYNIRTDRIFLAGFGMGGSLAHCVALRNPSWFAGALSVQGRFPDVPGMLRQWKRARQLPLLWMHGTKSRWCGEDALAQLLVATHRAGLKVFPAQFPVGDELDSAMLAMANRFMMQIVTGESIRLLDSVTEESL